MLLVIYVDDFKMAGPEKNMAIGWQLLRKGLKIDPETPLGLYLGSKQSMVEHTLPDGTKLRGVMDDMQAFAESCVNRYLTVAGLDIKAIKLVKTPLLESESTRRAREVLGDASKGVLCPWCCFTF
ncbi:MAG: hypothetical protein GY703_13365, partial [Gammaproteobacteria bacterium]|nr:hypothetical protein [Gammaproteobacteria bacterium]